MGGVNSNEQTIEQFKKEFEEVKTQYDQHFGEIVVYRKIHNHNFMVMAKDRIFNDEREAQKFLKRAKIRMRSHNGNVAKILTFFGKFQAKKAFLTTVEHKSDTWCSNMRKITIVYEYHERTLEQLIRHRKNYASDSVRVSVKLLKPDLIFRE